MRAFGIVSFFILLCSSVMLEGAIVNPYSDEGCGDTRGCFDCSDRVSTCDVEVAWKPNFDANTVTFWMWGSASGAAYIAMGITPTQNMMDADVYACIVGENDTAILRRSQNAQSGRVNTARDLVGVSGDSVSRMDGEIRCQFTRQINKANITDASFFDITGPAEYYLILASGTPNGELLTAHDGGSRAASEESYVLSAANIGRCELWILFLGILMAFHVTK